MYPCMWDLPLIDKQELALGRVTRDKEYVSDIRMIIQGGGHTGVENIGWYASNGHKAREICGLIIAVAVLILILDGCP